MEDYKNIDSNTESAKENGWSSLERMGDDGFSKEASAKLDNPEESSADKRERVLEAAADLRDFYSKKESSQEQANEEAIPQTRQASSGGITERYNQMERPRVDAIKANIGGVDMSYYERRQISTPPNAVTKLFRLAANKLGIRTKRGEERRNREAMAVALAEYREERDASRRQSEERARKSSLEYEERLDDIRKRDSQRDQELLSEQMGNAFSVLEDRKIKRLQRQRVQEIVERNLNHRLLTVDTLDMEVLSENSGVDRRTISYEGDDIPVYDLKGLPFSILSTTIDYRKDDGSGSFGTETYKAVMENPAIWAERRDVAERSEDFGIRHTDVTNSRRASARGDVISASYYNSEHNPDSYVDGDLIYGFAKVEADSVIAIRNSDAGSGNMAGTSETLLDDPDKIAKIETVEARDIYNEVVMRRYLENGVAKRPDYIIASNGKISEAAKRSAKFFKIPIINIERSVYQERILQRGNELLDSVIDQDSYTEINKKISELRNMARFKSLLPIMKTEGLDGDELDLGRQPTDLEKKCLDVSRIEFTKRLDFIKDSLENMTTNGIQNLAQFEDFQVSIRDVDNERISDEEGDRPEAFYGNSGKRNSIAVLFRIKGSDYPIETVIYDGARIVEPERPTSDIMGDNKSSNYYDAIEPLARKYLELIRTNKKT